MSIAKTLIQKEIARFKRGISFCNERIKIVSAKDSPASKKLTKDELAATIKDRKTDISSFEKAIKELETDLKKL